MLETGLVNPRTTSTNSPYTQHSPVDNLKISIQRKADPYRSDIVIPLCNDTKKIFSVTKENNFVNSSHAITIKKGNGRKEGIEINRVSSRDKHNTMIYHSNESIF